jgi:hypothetical protein
MVPVCGPNPGDSAERVQASVRDGCAGNYKIRQQLRNSYAGEEIVKAKVPGETYQMTEEAIKAIERRRQR